MRKWLAVGAIVSWVCQAVLSAVAGPRSAIPDLPLLVSQFVALMSDPVTGAMAGFLAGLPADLMASRYIGLNALAMGACGMVTGLAGRRLYSDRLLVPLLVGFGSTMLCNLFQFLILRLVGAGVSFVDRLGLILKCSACNGLLGPIVFAAISGARSVRAALTRQV